MIGFIIMVVLSFVLVSLVTSVYWSGKVKVMELENEEVVATIAEDVKLQDSVIEEIIGGLTNVQMHLNNVVAAIPVSSLKSTNKNLKKFGTVIARVSQVEVDDNGKEKKVRFNELQVIPTEADDCEVECNKGKCDK